MISDRTMPPLLTSLVPKGVKMGLISIAPYFNMQYLVSVLRYQPPDPLNFSKGVMGRLLLMVKYWSSFLGNYDEISFKKLCQNWILRPTVLLSLKTIREKMYISRVWWFVDKKLNWINVLFVWTLPHLIWYDHCEKHTDC